MAEVKTTSPRKIIAQNLDEAKTAAYANDPQTALVILGLSENAAVTTCGGAKRFFENRPSGLWLQASERTLPCCEPSLTNWPTKTSTHLPGWMSRDNCESRPQSCQ